MQSPKRFRDYGFNPGILPTGQKNQITDVPGVSVGHVSLISGDDVRTGVTVLDPGVSNLYKEKLPAGVAVGNGSGKVAGFLQVQELGTIEAPIGLTNSLAVGAVMRGLINHVVETEDLDPIDSINTVVGEVNDGFLNNIHLDTVQPEHVKAALSQLQTNVKEGCVGAGTGSRSFNWKGGIGTSSRIIKIDGTNYTLGALVQTNYGGSLNIMGVPIGQILGKEEFTKWQPPTGDGSCMIVLATDAPVDARQLSRIARRSFLSLGKTGSVLASWSGDFAVAFTTNRSGLGGQHGGKTLLDSDLTSFFLGTIEVVEESVYNAIFAAETTSGRDDNKWEKLPIDTVINLLNKHGRQQ